MTTKQLTLGADAALEVTHNHGKDKNGDDMITSWSLNPEQAEKMRRDPAWDADIRAGLSAEDFATLAKAGKLAKV